MILFLPNYLVRHLYVAVVMQLNYYYYSTTTTNYSCVFSVKVQKISNVGHIQDS